ncbi:hypothetical protein JC221_127 [Yersinia phage JC221]|nr:hypothetical protein JC221_127 [Yersinia phage JC221]
MANVSLINFSPKLGITHCNGFASTAEELFQFAFGVAPDNIDQNVMAEINKTGRLYYSRLTTVPNGVQYQSTLELLKSELKEIGEL